MFFAQYLDSDGRWQPLWSMTFNRHMPTGYNTLADAVHAARALHSERPTLYRVLGASGVEHWRNDQ